MTNQPEPDKTPDTTPGDNTTTMPPHIADFIDEPLDLRDNGDETFTLLTPFTYVVHGVGITVPAGFITDFASVPRAFWGIIAPYGKHGKAAVIHDYLYSTRGLGDLFTREECDQVFLLAMTDLGVNPIKRRIMWLGVRAFGGIHYPPLPSAQLPSPGLLSAMRRR